MKTTFLVITSKVERTVDWPVREGYVRDFCKQLEEELDDVKVIFTTYQDLLFQIKGNQFSIFDTRNNIDLKTVSFVHFKHWMYDIEQSALVAFYLNKHAINFYNSEVNIKVANGKIAQMFYLADKGLPVPDTFFANRKYFSEIFANKELPEGFKLPFIMKAEDGSKGDNNHLVRDFDQAIKILKEAEIDDTQFVIQNFIPNDGDYRVLFVGIEESPLIFLRTAQAGSHLNNTSKGGSGQIMDLNKLPKDFIKISKAAAEVLEREIGGVDIIINKDNGEMFVLEVNGTPAVATGYAVDEKMSLFVNLIQKNVDLMEEE